ncbi:MAG: hypothetical protein NVS4B12_10200 [Ktedonobacteraceae bacterium]
MNCQEFEELSGAYVLDAVTPEERDLAEEHVAQCSHCALVVQELQLAVNALPLSVPTVEPSTALKERILNSIQSDSVVAPQPMRQAVQTKAPVRRRNSWQRWSTQLLAAAALIMLVLFSGMTAWNIALQQQISSLSASTASVSYAIQGQNTDSRATGNLTCIPKQQLCVLAMRDLPALKGTQVYQGWLLRGNEPMSIGLLNVHNGIATVDFQGNTTGYDTAAVSVEPGPVASPSIPRGQIIAIGKVSGPV